jgi:hypothetical protein
MWRESPFIPFPGKPKRSPGHLIPGPISETVSGRGGTLIEIHQNSKGEDCVTHVRRDSRGVGNKRGG